MSVKYALSICLVLAVYLLVADSRAAARGKSVRHADIVGAWFCPLQGSAVPLPTEALVVFHRGGTMTANDTNDLFGLSARPELGGATLNSPNQGIWRRTKHGFESNFFGFMFSGAAAGADQGLLANTFRLRCESRIAGESFSGVCDLDLWAGVDTNGDGILESRDPATTTPTISLEDLVGFECSRLPLSPKDE